MMRILVTGATGYVGGRLVPRLLAAGHQVFCLVRRPGSLDDRPWRDRVEVRIGDLLDPDTLEDGLAGCNVAYYLVHSMGRHGDFRRVERESAHNLRAAADSAGLSRIVYLGGLGRGRLSEHLASRQEVGRLLAEGPVPVTELRAAVVIGSGSLSSEMLRSLTEVLPVMTTPKWVRTHCQPIAVEDSLALLENALIPMRMGAGAACVTSSSRVAVGSARLSISHSFSLPDRSVRNRLLEAQWPVCRGSLLRVWTPIGYLLRPVTRDFEV